MALFICMPEIGARDWKETKKGKSASSPSADRGHVRNVGRSAVHRGGAFAVLRVVEGGPSYRVGEGPGSDLPEGRTHSPLLHPGTGSATAVAVRAIPNGSRQTGTLSCIQPIIYSLALVQCVQYVQNVPL